MRINKIIHKFAINSGYSYIVVNEVSIWCNLFLLLHLSINLAIIVHYCRKLIISFRFFMLIKIRILIK